MKSRGSMTPSSRRRLRRAGRASSNIVLIFPCARREAALRAWARRDERVAARISGIEKKRSAHVSSVLRDIGFAPAAAESWAEVALLVYLGWLDRATRDLEFQVSGRGLSQFLSDLILAASARSSAGIAG